jgi:hypothetical protein
MSSAARLSGFENRGAILADNIPQTTVLTAKDMRDLLARTDEILRSSTQMAAVTRARMDANHSDLALAKREMTQVEDSQRTLDTNIESADRRIAEAKAKILEANKAFGGALVSLSILTLTTTLRTASQAGSQDAQSAQPPAPAAGYPLRTSGIDPRQHRMGRVVLAADADPSEATPDYSFNKLRIDDQPLLACMHNDGGETSVMDVLEHLGNQEWGSAARDVFGDFGPGTEFTENFADGNYGSVAREIYESETFRGAMEAIGEGMQRDLP